MKPTPGRVADQVPTTKHISRDEVDAQVVFKITNSHLIDSFIKSINNEYRKSVKSFARTRRQSVDLKKVNKKDYPSLIEQHMKEVDDYNRHTIIKLRNKYFEDQDKGLKVQAFDEEKQRLDLPNIFTSAAESLYQSKLQDKLRKKITHKFEHYRLHRKKRLGGIMLANSVASTISAVAVVTGTVFGGPIGLAGAVAGSNALFGVANGIARKVTQETSSDDDSDDND